MFVSAGDTASESIDALKGLEVRVHDAPPLVVFHRSLSTAYIVE
jgi:hypothetical protein